MDWFRPAVLQAGGFAKVSALSGLSLSLLYAVASGHRSLTMRSVKALKPHLKVAASRWTA